MKRVLVAFIFALSSVTAVSAMDSKVGRSLVSRTGLCQPTPTKMKFINMDGYRETISRIYVNMPGTNLSFWQGGKANSCVIVNFSALAWSGSGSMYIQATLDGVDSAVPNEWAFLTEAKQETRSASFVFPSVAPGLHSLWIRYLNTNTHIVVAVTTSNTIVYFAP